MLDTIGIDELREGPLEVTVDVAPGEFGLTDETFRFEGNLRGQLTFRLIGHDVAAQGRLSAGIVAPCVRCLVPARGELIVPVNEIWFCENPEADEPSGRGRRRKSAKPPLPGDDLEDENSFKGDELDPRDTLRELIMAELPDLPKCREDCKGLCLRCGANLNTGACACEVESDIGDAGGDAASAVESDDADAAPHSDWQKAMRDLRGKVEE